MNLLTELKNHIDYEFSRNTFAILKESRGTVTDIDMFVSNISKATENQINTAIRTKTEIEQTYTNNNTQNVLNGDAKFFFSEFDITLTFGFADKKRYGGYTDIKRSIIQTKDGGVICRPTITLRIFGPKEEDLYYVLSLGLGHELVHIYNFYRYCLENQNADLIANYKSQGYDKFYSTLQWGTGIRKKVAKALYILNRLERNAYIGMLRQELQSKKDEIRGSKNALSVVKQTESYEKFQDLSKFIDGLKSLDPESEDAKRIVSAVNDMMKKNYTTFGQVIKYFTQRWEKWKKKYMIMASKIVYDIWSEDKLPMVPNSNQI